MTHMFTNCRTSANLLWRTFGLHLKHTNHSNNLGYSGAASCATSFKYNKVNSHSQQTTVTRTPMVVPFKCVNCLQKHLSMQVLPKCVLHQDTAFVHKQSCAHIATSVPESNMNCWNCGAQSHVHFCTECKLVQPPNYSLNYFEVLRVPSQFDLHLPTLTRNFKNLQARLHPDLFTLKSQEEQVHSADQSALVNQAYQTLLKPLPRALYLLEIFGHPIEEGTTDKVDPKFFMEIMEINEEIARAESFELLHDVDEANQKALKSLTEELEVAFKNADYLSANAVVCRLKYFANLDDRLRGLELKSKGL